MATSFPVDDLGQGLLRQRKRSSGWGPISKAGDQLLMAYTGTLADGTVFDSNEVAGRQLFDFTLGAGQVIQRWDLGLVGVQVGDSYQLSIPAALGYGSRGSGSIPPNAPLTFQVTVWALLPAGSTQASQASYLSTTTFGIPEVWANQYLQATPTRGPLQLGFDSVDLLTGTDQGEIIFSAAGDDDLAGLAGDDLLGGGAGFDTLRGGSGADWLFGGPGADTLYGGQGPDRLFGGNGHDKLYGNKGRDVLTGGLGNDWLEGGEGDDRFVIGPGNDTIADFGIDSGDVLEIAAGRSYSLEQRGSDLALVMGDGITLVSGISRAGFDPAVHIVAPV